MMSILNCLILGFFVFKRLAEMAIILSNPLILFVVYSKIYVIQSKKHH